MTGGAVVDRRAATVLVLRHVRGDHLAAQSRHKIGAVITLIGAQCDRLRGVGVGFDQPQRRPPLGMARGGCGHRANNQTVAVLHQRVAHETQPRLLPQSLAEQAGVGIGRRPMRVIAARLAVKIPLAIAALEGAREIFCSPANLTNSERRSRFRDDLSLHIV